MKDLLKIYFFLIFIIVAGVSKAQQNPVDTNTYVVVKTTEWSTLEEY